MDLLGWTLPRARILMGFYLHCWSTVASLYRTLCLLFLFQFLSRIDIADISNYISICILNKIPKPFENLIIKNLTCLLNSTQIDQQISFRPNRSAKINLLNYVDFLSSSLVGGGKVHSLYKDFSKAFDKVNHAILLHKIEQLGVTGILSAWIRRYLLDRHLIVKFYDYHSEHMKISSGITQT